MKQYISKRATTPILISNSIVFRVSMLQGKRELESDMRINVGDVVNVRLFGKNSYRGWKILSV